MDLGFNSYTEPFNDKSKLDVFAITLALMVGTAGLPHVIVRFFTVPRVRDARISAGWALLFIAILYSTAPAIGALSRLNLIHTVNGEQSVGTAYSDMPQWFKTWENSGLIGWHDHNGDGRVQLVSGPAFEGVKPQFDGEQRGPWGERKTLNPVQISSTNEHITLNELYVDHDIMVLANPEIAGLPNWVVALIAAGGIAAALSTAAGLLLVISVSVSHDLLKRTFARNISEKSELLAGRLAAAAAVIVAGYLGLNPPRICGASSGICLWVGCILTLSSDIFRYL